MFESIFDAKLSVLSFLCEPIRSDWNKLVVLEKSKYPYLEKRGEFSSILFISHQTEYLSFLGTYLLWYYGSQSHASSWKIGCHSGEFMYYHTWDPIRW
jgi:hypothetical protein